MACSPYCQHISRPPAVHQVVRSSHGPSTPVHGITLEMRLEVTGADWSGHRFITRTEGVPGSSPGVGSESPAQRLLSTISENVHQPSTNRGDGVASLDSGPSRRARASPS